MIAEIELHFAGRTNPTPWGDDAPARRQDPYSTVEQVEVSCPTELANLAYSKQRQQGAESVSFGPVIDREEKRR